MRRINAGQEVYNTKSGKPQEGARAYQPKTISNKDNKSSALAFHRMTENLAHHTTREPAYADGNPADGTMAKEKVGTGEFGL